MTNKLLITSMNFNKKKKKNKKTKEIKGKPLKMDCQWSSQIRLGDPLGTFKHTFLPLYFCCETNLHALFWNQAAMLYYFIVDFCY